MDILTEEELNVVERKLGAMLNANRIDFEEYEMFSDVRLSHKKLIAANAELSFKKEIFKRAVEDIIVAVDFTDAETVRALAFKALEEAK